MTFSFENTAAVTSADADKPIGHVISCRGSAAKMGLFSTESLGQQRATVGKFVAIRSGENLLLGMIAELSAATEEHFEEMGIRAIAHVDLMGEIIRGAAGSHFRRGVRDYPAIGDEGFAIRREDLRLVYSNASSSAMKIGNLHQDATISAYVDADNLLSKHFAVLGSTGVGKSSGVAVILDELIRARPDVRLLLLDVHNEYGHSFGDKANVVGADNLKLPFWLLNFEEMIDVIYSGRPAVPEEVEILAELIPVAKASYMSIKNSGERSLLARRGARDMGFSPDTPSPYLMQDLLTLIDERMGKLENRSTRMLHHRLTMRIEALNNDPRYGFMFENANVGGDTMAAVLDQLFRLSSNSAGITILKLASLPSEVLDAVVCMVCRLAFEFGVWSDGAVPVLIACEEAHRYASADHAQGFAPARRALSRIAKEGRKYGVYLGLVTQRPAELDPTIISQCSTLFVMRMSNEEDQLLLRSAVTDAAANLLSFMPSLGTGEVVGLGEGMPLPTRFAFRKLPSHLVPSSEPVEHRRGEMSKMPRDQIVRTAIERWSKATTSQAKHEEKPVREPVAGSNQAPGQDAISRGLMALASERREKSTDPDRHSLLRNW